MSDSYIKRTWVTTDRVGSERGYLLYKRGILGMRGKLIAAFSSAADALTAIGTGWPGFDKEMLYAVYENGRLRRVKQSFELVKIATEAPGPGTF
jgi:hypothetical protein